MALALKRQPVCTGGAPCCDGCQHVCECKSAPSSSMHVRALFGGQTVGPHACPPHAGLWARLTAAKPVWTEPHGAEELEVELSPPNVPNASFRTCKP